jgi:hypothetical protein
MRLRAGGVRVPVSSIGIGLVAGLVSAAVVEGIGALAESLGVPGQSAAILVGIIEIAALLAIFAGGWVALILNYRAQPRWRTLAVVAVLLEAVLLGLGLVAQVSILVVWAGGLVLMCVELVAASVVPAPVEPRRHPWWHVAAAIVWPPAVLSGAYVALVAAAMAAERGI